MLTAEEQERDRQRRAAYTWDFLQLLFPDDLMQRMMSAGFLVPETATKPVDPHEPPTQT